MKAKHFVWTRRISQSFFLIFFIFLLIESRLPLDIYMDYSIAITSEQNIELNYPVTFFFQLDPLIALTSFISGHQWIKGFGWAIGIVVLTLFFGRLFCGFICPLGTIHHLMSFVRPALKGQTMVRANQKRPDHKFKYFILILLLMAAILGLNFTGMLDPIAFLFRSLSLAIFPGLGTGIKEVFDLMAQSDIKILNYISYGAEIIVSPVFGYGYEAFKSAWLIGSIFLIILFLNRIRPRFWCRTLCPLGALLGVFSRFSILKMEKYSEKCTQCQLCTQTCQGAASPIPGLEWEPTEVSDARLIRPPGAVPEKDFLKLCQRCGLCMKVCPTNAINPTLTEAGMAGFWTPNLIMLQGYCEYTCTLCGSVCPTGAIHHLSVKEKIKSPIRIGSAYIYRGRCLPWAENGPCIVCEEHCPTSPKAIHLKEETYLSGDGKTIRVKRPYVDLNTCVGCGICENKCPVRGRPAIRVMAAGETRSVKNQILLGE